MEDDWLISEKFRMNAGLHLSLFNIDGKTNYGLGPRLSFQLQTFRKLGCKSRI